MYFVAATFIFLKIQRDVKSQNSRINSNRAGTLFISQVAVHFGSIIINGCNFSFQNFCRYFVLVITVYFVIFHCKWYLMKTNKQNIAKLFLLATGWLQKLKRHQCSACLIKYTTIFSYRYSSTFKRFYLNFYFWAAVLELQFSQKLFWEYYLVDKIFGVDTR